MTNKRVVDVQVETVYQNGFVFYWANLVLEESAGIIGYISCFDSMEAAQIFAWRYFGASEEVIPNDGKWVYLV